MGIIWSSLLGVRGGLESSGKRFTIRPAAIGGVEMLDRRERRRYKAGRTDPLKAKAEQIVTDSSESVGRWGSRL